MADKPKSIKGTRTEKCLIEAYISESGAYTRYTYYAKQATKENYFGLADIFTETADNELHHGKIFFKYLEGGNVPVTVNAGAGTIGDTMSNLRQAAEGEHVEEGTVWKREKPIRWLCLVCGYVYEGKEPPEVCPGCDHPREHYVPLD